MTRLILESNNKNDLLLIKELADRLKIKFKIQNLTEPKNITQKDKEKYIKIINKGVDVSNFGDPSVWQKKVREDRNLNL